MNNDVWMEKGLLAALLLLAFYNIAELTAKSVPIEEWLIKSTIPDIGIAWGDFFIGKALYDLYMKGQLYIHQPSP